MYDSGVTQTQIFLASKKLRLPIKRRSLAETNWWIAHLDSLLSDDGLSLRRKLTQQEIDFIKTERALCKWDALYFITRYIWIKAADGTMVRLALTIAQKIIFDILAELERKGVAKKLLLLKARQGGITTFSVALQCHLYNFFTGRKGIIQSSTPGKTAAICNDKLKLMWDHLPWWLKPEINFLAVNDNKSGDFAQIAELGSVCVASAGNQKTDRARGDTWQIAHVTELDEHLNPGDDIEAALMNAIHDYPLSFCVVEGTGGEIGTWWYFKYKAEKEHQAEGIGQFTTRFLPWYLFTDIHPTAAWIRQTPVPANWEPESYTTEQARKAAEYVASDLDLQRYLGVGWTMPIEQQWHYEVMYKSAKKAKKLYKFQIEWAADDMSCFQNDAQRGFDEEMVFTLRDRKREPIAVYGIWSADGHIPKAFKPKYEDIDMVEYAAGKFRPLEIIPVRSHLLKSNKKPYDFQLIRLKWRGSSSDDPDGKLLIWHMPEQESYYGLGADFAMGLEQDNTAFEVIARKDFRNLKARQCAEFVSGRIKARDSWPFLLAIGTFYSFTNTGTQMMVQPRAIIEGQMSGDRAVEDLHLRGWKNFHRWHKLARKHLNLDNINSLCWYTNVWSRQMAVEQIEGMLRDEEFEANSPFLVEEIANIERALGSVKAEASYGFHDDRFITCAFTLFSLHYRWTEHRQDQQKESDLLNKQRIEQMNVTFEKDYERLMLGGAHAQIEEQRRRAMGI